MERIRLLLLDDHVLFREGLSRLLASEPDFEMIANCGAFSEALDAIRERAVDIILLDFDLGDERGTAFLLAARDSGFKGKVLMLTAGMTATESSMALRLGASGIFLKHNSPATLANAIRQVAAGEMWMDKRIVQSMADGIQRGDDTANRILLTNREQEVLRGVFEGLTNKEIAEQIGASETTVKAALQQLFEKTRVRTRSQLVRIALESSLVARRKS